MKIEHSYFVEIITVVCVAVCFVQKFFIDKIPFLLLLLVLLLPTAVVIAFVIF